MQFAAVEAAQVDSSGGCPPASDPGSALVAEAAGIGAAARWSAGAAGALAAAAGAAAAAAAASAASAAAGRCSSSAGSRRFGACIRRRTGSVRHRRWRCFCRALRGRRCRTFRLASRLWDSIELISGRAAGRRRFDLRRGRRRGGHLRLQHAREHRRWHRMQQRSCAAAGDRASRCRPRAAAAPVPAAATSAAVARVASGVRRQPRLGLCPVAQDQAPGRHGSRQRAGPGAAGGGRARPARRLSCARPHTAQVIQLAQAPRRCRPLRCPAIRRWPPDRPVRPRRRAARS